VTERVLCESTEPLASRYDVALLDLDGVVYRGSEVIEDAAAALEKAAHLGMRRAYVTNNAAAAPETVAERLSRMGVPAGPGDVITSAQAAAHVLADRLPPGAPVLVVGTEALGRELTSRGLAVVSAADEHPVAVVQGYSPDTGWRQLAEAVVAVRRGALWVATNTDLTIPSPRGALPGNGAFVAVVRAATDLAPLVTGKPEPAMHHEMMQRTGARRPLIVGDRLDTDIEGATRASVDSLLVLTGVTTPRLLIAAPPQHRPTYLSAGLGGLLATHPAPRHPGGDAAHCGGYTATAGGLELHLAGDGDDLDALRALCASWWARHPGGLAPSAVHGTGPAGAALQRLGLR
jgi:HAD superfamily hydrolase (TIGR01450 family)